jgi:hypothetical protein
VKAHLKLQQWWNETSSGISTTTISAVQIQALEQRYAVSLPDDFRAYLSASSPVKDPLDDNVTCWWPFERIRNIPEEYEHEVSSPEIANHQSQYLFFADYAIWCWAWAISCTNDENRGKVALIGGLPDRFVAGSFSEFVERYISDFRSVC